MKIGISVSITDTTMRPDDLAREVEARGFESLWVPEHTHIPADRRDASGNPLPERYWRTYDPFVALTAAAVATTRLRLGTGVCLLIQRDPITTAKTVASLDTLSQGRFELGVGGGWNREEMANHHCDYATRWRRLREHVAVMKEIWSKEEAQFEGEFTRFGPMLSFPKPVQAPHPPILLGGHGPKALARVVDYCDGWFPIARLIDDPASALKELRRLAEEKGRDPSTLTVTVYGVPPTEAALAPWRKAGAQRAILGLPAERREDVLTVLDRHACLLEAAHA